MKKRLAYLFAAVVATAVLAVGCTAVEEGFNGTETIRGNADAIAFSVNAEAFGSPATKAAASEIVDNGCGMIVSLEDISAPLTRTAPGTITIDGAGGVESLRDRGLGVFAAHTGLHRYASSSVSAGFMYNEHVTYDASNSVWTYSPLKYWPAGDNNPEGEFVSFFAYAPYAANPGTGSSNAEKCIIDFQQPSETGDPWIIYRLGGTRDDFLDYQTDLVYGVNIDQRRGSDFHLVRFDLQHALACVADAISINTTPALNTKIQAIADAYAGRSVTLTVNTLSINLNLTSKGKLVLNGSSTPNWQVVSSGSAAEHRVLTPAIASGQVASTSEGNVLAQSTITLKDNGVFCIPLSLGDSPQRASVALGYTLAITNASDPADPGIGTYSSRVGGDLNMNALVAGQNLGVNITLSGSLPLSIGEETGSSQGLIILDIAPVTYNGSAQTPPVVVTDASGRVMRNTDYSLTWIDNTNAGKAMVVATGLGDYAGQSATAVFTINKAASTLTVTPTAKVLEWNGTAQELVNPGATPDGELQYALGTAAAPTGSYSTDIPAATEAITHYVWYRIVGDANHEDTGNMGPVVVTIGRLPSSVVYAPEPNTAALTPPPATYTDLVLPGLAIGGVMYYATGTSTAPETEFSPAIPQHKDPGTYYIWYKVVGDETHTDTQVLGPVTVVIPMP